MVKYTKTILLSVLMSFACISCHSSKQKEIIIKTNVVNKSTLAILANKIHKTYSNGNFTEEDANLAFLVAKELEKINNIQDAQKIYEECFNFSPNVMLALNLIQTSMQLQKIETARNIAAKSSVLFPNNPDIALYYIKTEHLLKHNEESSRLLDKYFKLFPTNETLAILYAQSKYKNSIKILVNFINKNPDTPKASYLLSQYLFLKNRPTEALPYAKQALKYDPENIDILNLVGKIEDELGHKEAAKNYFESAFEKNNADFTTAQYYIDSLIKLNKEQEALSILLQIESQLHDNMAIKQIFSFQIAKLLILNGNYNGAIQRLKFLDKSTLTKLSISEDEVYYINAIAYRGARNFRDAIYYTDKISKHSNLYKKALIQKILIFIDNEDKGNAERYFKIFQTLSDENEADLDFMSSVLIVFKKYNEALNLIASIHTPNSELKKFDIYLFQRKKTSFIVKKLNKLLKKWPNNADILNTAGYTFAKLNINIKKAKELLLRSLAREPENPYYHDSLGYLEMQQGQLEKALLSLNKALKLLPNNPVILNHYALLLKKLNDEVNASKVELKIKESLLHLSPYSIKIDPEYYFLNEKYFHDN